MTPIQITDTVAKSIIGLSVDEAIRIIKSEDKIYYALPNDVVTCDFRTDRIFLQIDENNIVTGTSIG